MKRFTLIIIAVAFTTIVGKSQGLLGAYINFPDSNFRNYLLTHGYDKDYNNLIDTNEVNSKTFLYIYRQNISDLTGIEYFRNLQYLRCHYNNITMLDLTKNPNLIELLCYNNKITIIDLSKNTNLTTLKCDSNKLNWLDISNNYNLIDIICSYNNLETINTSNNINLRLLSCSYNQLTFLDLKQNVKTKKLFCNNNNISKIEFDKNDSLYWFKCNYNQLTYLDISKCKNISTLYIDNNKNLTNVCVYSLPLPSSNIKALSDDSCSSSLKYDTICKLLDVNENNNISNTIIIYPSPAKDVINVNYNIGNENIYNNIEEINIYNIVGKKVMVAKQNTDADKYSINVSDLTPNIYIVEIKTSKQIYRSKFVKE